MKKFLKKLFFLLFLFPVGSVAQQYVPYGGPFTPKGDIRFLIIYAGFESECDGSTGGIWPDISMPGGKPGSGFPVYRNDLFYSGFDQFKPEASDKTISNFYYQMSRSHPENPPLRIVADVFPERINIKGSSPDNNAVFRIIQQNYPDFDWSKYDQRKNYPAFKDDYSQTNPDGLIDYIVVAWRRRGAGGYANTSSFTFTTNENGVEKKFSTHSVCGFTITRAMADNLLQVKHTFHHELAHTLFNCPHVFGANGVTGDYFYASTGWGMMDYGSLNSSMNAWERWYNGWIELDEKKDLQNYQDNGVYTLRDFVNTGDALRIKLPFVDQYLWIENHTGQTVFDDREEYARDGLGDSIPPPQRGLYLFIEGLADSRSKILSPLSLSFAGGMKSMHGAGNYDYSSLGWSKDPRLWNNIVIDFQQNRANPTSAHNDVCAIRGNFEYDSIFPDKIIYRNFTNNPDEYCRICSEPCPARLRQEMQGVAKKSGIYTYDALGINMAFGSGALPQKIGISHNPVIINHQKYNCPDSLDPVYLNGISITILERGGNGEITVEVKFDDVTIDSHQRMTGDLILNNIEHTAFDIHVIPGKSLTIDKSGTPNRHGQGKLINGRYEFPDFINPSSFIIQESAKLLIDDKAKLILREGTTMKIKAGGELTVTGKLVVGKGCKLELEPGASLLIKGKGKMKVSKKASFIKGH